MVEIIATRDHRTGEVTVHHVLPWDVFKTQDALRERVADLIEQVELMLEEPGDMIVAAAPDVLSFTTGTHSTALPRADGRYAPFSAFWAEPVSRRAPGGRAPS